MFGTSGMRLRREVSGPDSNNMKEKVLLISCPQDWKARFDIESIGTGLCDQVERQGGKGWAGWTDAGLKIRLHGMPAGLLNELMTTYFDAAKKLGEAVSVAEQEVNATPLPDLDAGEIPWGTVIRRKLTKKLLKSLPDGVWLASNLIHGSEEVLLDRIGPTATREVVWKRAVLVGANNRLCRVVWYEVDFDSPNLAGRNIPKGRI